MAVTVARLQVVLGAKTDDFERAMDRSESRMGKVGKAAGVAGLAIASGLAIGAKKAIDDASGLNESMNAVNVVFGDASNQIAAFSKVAAKQAGLSMRQLNELVTPIGASLRNTGFSADAAAKASVGLAKRAADMASVFNVDVSEALSAIQAGLRGEADPLERFGVGLSAAVVQSKALKMGLAQTVKGLTSQDLAQARLGLVMEQTNKVAGDFAKTSSEVANKQRINAAVAENQRAKLGTGLLPVMKSYQNLLGAVTGFMAEHTTVTKIAVGVVSGLATVLLAVSVAAKVKAAALSLVTAKTKLVTAAQWLWNAALTANPIGLVVVALAAFGVALFIAWKKSETFRDIVTGAWTKVKEVVDSVARFFTDTVFPKITAFIGDVKGLFVGIKDWLSDNWKKALVLLLTGLPGALWLAVSSGWLDGFLDPIKRAFSGVTGWLRDNWRTALVTMLTGLPGLLWKAFSGSWGGKGGALGQFKDAFTGIKDWIFDVLKDIVALFGGLPGRVVDKVTGAVKGALGKAKDLVPDLNPFGDVAPGFNAAAAAAARGGLGLAPQTASLLSHVQSAFGNVVVSSAFRSPEENRRVGGAPNSDHLTGRAFDLVPASGWTAAAVAHFDKIASYLAGLSSVRWIGWRGVKGHGPGDHLHVSTFDKGGWLPPKSATLAINRTSQWEPVGPPGRGGGITVNINGPVYGSDSNELARKLFDALKAENTRQGRLGRGLA